MTLRQISACLLLLGAIAATPALAENDEVQFGSDIRVGPDSTIHDAVCFFCSVDVQGKATGDIVVFFGSVHVSGDAQHDLVNFFGNFMMNWTGGSSGQPDPGSNSNNARQLWEQRRSDEWERTLRGD